MKQTNTSQPAFSGIQTYQKNASNELILEHASLVKKIAMHLQARLPDSVQLDDLIQAGMIGLMEAAKSYSPDKGAKFSTFASIRIRGAILDEVRNTDWTPRSVSRNVREMGAAIQRVENRTGKKAHDREIAEEMDISLTTFHKISREAVTRRLISTEELVDEEGSPTLHVQSADKQPSESLHHTQLKQSIVSAINDLPEKERLMISLYYNDELNLKEIGKVLGVSESRVSQIHSQALSRIRTKVQHWTE